MSLLLKALQKAGEDRIGVAGQAASAHSLRELTLQPVDHVSTMRKPIYTEASPAQAAAILAASSPRTGVADYVRERPLMVFSAAAGSFLIAYGAYVYMQLSPPARVSSSTYVAAAPGAYQPQSPAAALPAAALRGAASPSAPRMASTHSGPIASAQAAQLPSAEAAIQRVAPSVPAVAKEPPPSANGSAEPVPNQLASPVGIATESATHSVRNKMIDESASAQPVSTPRSKQSAISIAKTNSGSNPMPVSEPVRSIDIGRETPAIKINQDLADAYQALQSGQQADAESRYKKLAQAEPKNADVLLGLAAIAIQQNQSEQASEYYFRILESDPKNAFAQAGLIAVGGQADRQNAETRLKQLIDREPSAFLYFVLGNLYADQSLWAAAQAAYFQAHHLQPEHPDYAFNLAIGLEHLSQRKLSVDYYRRALSLAALRGNASFDATTVERHVAQLTAAGE